MPNINLIAARREEKKRMERLTRQLFFGLAASVGALVVLVTYLGAERFKLNGELAEAQEKIQRLQPKLDEIARIQKDTNDLKPKVDTLQTAKSATLRWRVLMTAVSQAIPDNTFITTFSSTGGDAGSIIMLGTSDTLSRVGDTMSRLNEHPIFNQIVLDHTSSNPGGVDTPPQVTFQIMAHLRPPAAPPAPAGAAAPADAAGKTASSMNSTGKEGHNDHSA